MTMISNFCTFVYLNCHGCSQQKCTQFFFHYQCKSIQFVSDKLWHDCVITSKSGIFLLVSDWSAQFCWGHGFTYVTLQTEICPALRQHRGLHWCGCVASGTSERGSPDWVADLWIVRLLRRQHTARVYNTHRQDFTTVESYRRSTSFIFCHDNRKVNSANTALKFQSNLPRMCTCTYVTGQRSALPGESWARCDVFTGRLCGVLHCQTDSTQINERAMFFFLQGYCLS